MQEGKTIGQLMEEMRQKAGAQNYHGHDYMDLQRFAENTRHMIIFDVLTDDSPVGWKGERTRLFLSEIGYEKALDSQAKGQIKILSHARSEMEICSMTVLIKFVEGGSMKKYLFRWLVVPP